MHACRNVAGRSIEAITELRIVEGGRASQQA